MPLLYIQVITQTLILGSLLSLYGSETIRAKPVGNSEHKSAEEQLQNLGLFNLKKKKG